MWLKLSDIYFTVEEKLRVNLNQEIYSTGDRTPAPPEWGNDISLDHSDGRAGWSFNKGTDYIQDVGFTVCS